MSDIPDFDVEAVEAELARSAISKVLGRVHYHEVFAEARRRYIKDATQAELDEHLFRVTIEQTIAALSGKPTL